MGFDQQLQSGVPPLPENLSPGMYTQSRMPNQPVPMQRTMRPMMRPTMSPNMISPRGRSLQRGSAISASQSVILYYILLLTNYNNLLLLRRGKTNFFKFNSKSQFFKKTFNNYEEGISSYETYKSR